MLPFDQRQTNPQYLDEKSAVFRDLIAGQPTDVITRHQVTLGGKRMLINLKIGKTVVKLTLICSDETGLCTDTKIDASMCAITHVHTHAHGDGITV